MSHLKLQARGLKRSRRSAVAESAYPDANRLLKKASTYLPKLPAAWLACIPLAVVIVMGYSLAAQAQGADAPPTPEELKIILDNVWVFIATILVVFMNAGFAMLEAGFCRQKNAVNILTKNLIVFALATLAFWAIGYGLAFNEGNSFLGTGNFFLAGLDDTTPVSGTLAAPVFFLFQAAFAGTAATIVSGAVAERIRFLDFLIFSVILTAVVYPISAHWIWGGGMLSEIGFLGGTAFKDFAGSTVVHSVGGWAALVGAAFLGPRIGKYRSDGGAGALPGHNMSIATLGCLILWIGWFGFNPGSQLAADLQVPYIAVTTNLAAAAGGVAATLTSWMVSGKPDLSMVINGILAGLVAVTAGCAGFSYLSSVIVGLVAGVLVVFAVFFFDSIKIDDPVGATSVHLVNGIWGTLAVGLFDKGAGLLTGHGPTQLLAQIVGVITVAGWSVLTSVILWSVIRAIFGMRVSEEEEIVGLDISEHGMEAYSGFSKEEVGMGRAVSSR
ncbi:MAG: ammonium transporter [Synechococcales cyanobacterium CRU_2_2]|nr:ammonium transporter [Synechococcales cyanobacterium CRU_2_2]